MMRPRQILARAAGFVPRDPHRVQVLMVGQTRLPSMMLRRRYLAPTLTRLGIRTEVIHPLSLTRATMIRDAVVMFVKDLDPGCVDLARRLGNRIVYVPVDALAMPEYEANFGQAVAADLLDAIVYPTEAARRMRADGPAGKLRSTVIDAFSDPRILPQKADRFGMVYFGTMQPKSVNIDLLRSLIADRTVEMIDASRPDLGLATFADLRRFSCHYSVREADLLSSVYKPNAKLFVAAAADANIVISRGDATLDVLDPAYPFLTDTAPDAVRETIARARDAFGGPLWHEGLEILRPIRDANSLEGVAQRYLAFLEPFLRR